MNDEHIVYIISKNKTLNASEFVAEKIVCGKRERFFFGFIIIYRGIEQLYGTLAFSPGQVEIWLGCSGGGGVGAARRGSSWFAVPPLTKKK